MSGPDFSDHAHEILPRLWVGDQAASILALDHPEFKVLNVLENKGDDREMWIPILVAPAGRTGMIRSGATAYRERLDEAGEWICHGVFMRHTMLVHCGGGAERSPLTVVWYLMKYTGLSIDQAYAWLSKMRPQVMDRRNWIEP